MPGSSKPQHWSIDSIEEGVARLEIADGVMISLPAKVLPAGATEGQVLTVTLELAAGATEKARASSAKQTKAIAEASKKRDKDGDVVL